LRSRLELKTRLPDGEPIAMEGPLSNQ
jgi:hypothetical protein